VDFLLHWKRNKFIWERIRYRPSTRQQLRPAILLTGQKAFQQDRREWPMQCGASTIAYNACDSADRAAVMRSRLNTAFPAFEVWAQMSEREQNALLDRIDAVRRQKRWLRRLVGLAICLLVGAGIGVIAFIAF
jgi:hypothetical protein